MSASAAAGALALTKRDYPSAITCYTTALQSSPTSPEYLIQRSTAYQRSAPPRYDLALRDAEAAVHHAFKRGKREAIATAQMRRGIALFGLTRWADAGRCFEWAKAKGAPEGELGIWAKKVQVALEKSTDGDGVREITVVEVPDQEAAEKSQIQVEEKKSAPVVAEGVQTPKEKIRHEWYQTSENVVITLLVKGVPKEKATVEILDQSVGYRHVPLDQTAL